jgi:hypothetical protein
MTVVARRRRAAASVCALAIAACASSGTFDAGALRARYPVLASYSGQRLADATPYLAQSSDGVVLFLCRFSSGSPIPVLLPSDATGAERQVLVRALSAWSQLLPLELEAVSRKAPLPSRRIEIDFVDPPDYAGPRPAGNTIADCALPGAPIDAATLGETVDAELRYASVQLRRTRRDHVGRETPLSSSELLGVALHELGHALGYPGHVRGEGALMSARAQIDAARRWGRKLEEGRALESPTLEALYALPSGVRVGAFGVGKRPVDLLRRLRVAATGAGMDGPYSRVGDETARILWRGSAGTSAALVVTSWKQALKDPTAFELHANANARRLIWRTR